jgi:hypothetical protein
VYLNRWRKESARGPPRLQIIQSANFGTVFCQFIKNLVTKARPGVSETLEHVAEMVVMPGFDAPALFLEFGAQRAKFCNFAARAVGAA